MLINCIDHKYDQFYFSKFTFNTRENLIKNPFILEQFESSNFHRIEAELYVIFKGFSKLSFNEGTNKKKYEQELFL